MEFDIITLFPEIFDFYFKHSILEKACRKGIIKIKTVDCRCFAKDKHKTVDDRPFGGGRGMVLKVEPVFRAVVKAKKGAELAAKRKNVNIRKIKSKTILLSPRGEKFSQKRALQFSKLDQLIIISGRYEGVDERIAKYIADKVISIGDYVLMGGEIPAIILIESVARLVPGVIGKSNLLKERISQGGGFVEYPQYTRPEIFNPGKGKKKWRVPKVLLSGDHKKIEKWRKEHSKLIE